MRRCSRSRRRSEAGLDIVTDGEIRRESYSNRFATALDGVDIDNPGTALDRSGHPNPVPRVVGPIRRKHPVQVEDLLFLKRHTDRPLKVTVPGRSPWRSRRRTTTTATPRAGARLRRGRERRVLDLFAAGADIVQLDEPYVQARPEAARAYGVEALNRALEGADRHHRGAHLLRLRGDHPRAAVGLFVPAGTGRLQLRAGLDRDRAVQPRLSVLKHLPDKKILLGVLDLVRHECRDAARSSPRGSAAHCRTSTPNVSYRAGLRHEVPAAGLGRGQVARHGRGCGPVTGRAGVAAASRQTCAAALRRPSMSILLICISACMARCAFAGSDRQQFVQRGGHDLPRHAYLSFSQPPGPSSPPSERRSSSRRPRPASHS